ncbi:6-phosphogluconolactonase [Pseudoroseicyclus aestuarii]|uniref:6-phosphogluconolactonase n=1 Tax=Pseudoroseicyclus aestuarii TaxID=1795041 RepID=A0A318T0S6_9RHOB|nr:6-phosphogluconolactonase [Pseudoroseicyclus aestuarii]PYE86239.1 6-phosphogluconolactonase [Pseudoroseicyclus aestuarii]
MELIEYADAEMMMIDLANRLAGELREALGRDETASLAVPGGTTPGPIFDSLSSVDLDWDRVKVLLTDERWVPEDSPRSNTGLVKRRLMTDRAASATYVPLYLPKEQPEEAMEELSAAVGALNPISVVLLGMGADMHTASLFPGADRLAEGLTTEAPLVAMRAPGAPEARITLSAKMLNDAVRRHIVITGEAKREALEKARSLPPEEAPVAAILKNAVVHWAKE